MRLIVDANILFAALIKDGITSKLFLSDKLHLFTPEYLFIEFKQYEELILQKTKRSKEDFLKFLSFVKEKIQIIPVNLFRDYIKKAQIITPDPKDTIYLACAMTVKANIWSNDRVLTEEQEEIHVITTSELIEHLSKL